MNASLKSVLAVGVGIVLGGMVNMAIIATSGSIASLPEGVDPNDIESIRANIHRYSIINLLFPIIAHAFGTLVGAFTAAKIAMTNRKILAFLVGGFFLIGGVIMIRMLPEAPTWMKVVDIVLAYIPMAWVGWKLAGD